MNQKMVENKTHEIRIYRGLMDCLIQVKQTVKFIFCSCGLILLFAFLDNSIRRNSCPL